MKTKYFKEWLRSVELGFLIGWLSIEVNLGILTFSVSTDNLHFALALPKYGLVVTNSTKWFYDDLEGRCNNYWFYRKHLCGSMTFYVMHIIGVEATEIDDEEA